MIAAPITTMPGVMPVRDTAEAFADALHKEVGYFARADKAERHRLEEAAIRGLRAVGHAWKQHRHGLGFAWGSPEILFARVMASEIFESPFALDELDADERGDYLRAAAVGLAKMAAAARMEMSARRQHAANAEDPRRAAVGAADGADGVAAARTIAGLSPELREDHRAEYLACVLGVPMAAIQGGGRQPHVVAARWAIAAALRAWVVRGNPMSYPRIAMAIRGRRCRHTSVLQGVARLATNATARRMLAALKAEILRRGEGVFEEFRLRPAAAGRNAAAVRACTPQGAA